MHRGHEARFGATVNASDFVAPAATATFLNVCAPKPGAWIVRQ